MAQGYRNAEEELNTIVTYEALDDAGWVSLPGAMDADFLEEIRATVERLWEEEGENAGSEFRKEPGARRLANLVDKGEVFERVVSHPRVLEAVRHVLGDDFKLSSLNARIHRPPVAGMPTAAL